MREYLALARGFIRALPGLPAAIWTQRREIIDALFQRHVFFPWDRKRRAAYQAHLRDVEEWRRRLYEEPDA